MATTTKVLARGSASTSVGTTLYTVPASTTTVLTNIAVTNTAASAGTFTLAIAGTELHTTTAIASNTTVYIDCKQVLVTGSVLSGGASATTIKFHISGVEIA